MKENVEIFNKYVKEYEEWFEQIKIISFWDSLERFKHLTFKVFIKVYKL